MELSGGGMVAVSEQMAQEQDADTMRAACDGQCAVVGSIERKRVEKKPPKLYDLTTLQREANRYYGLTASQTLQAAQELYEEKLVTYPRTDSQFVTEDMRKTVEFGTGLGGAAADVKAGYQQQQGHRPSCDPADDAGRKVGKKPVRNQTEEVFCFIIWKWCRLCSRRSSMKMFW